MDDGVTVREAARECRRSPETIRRWIWDGKLPARKVGNQLFVRRADLEDRLAKGRERDRARRLAVLDAIDAVREQIRREIGGTFDVLAALDESRASHP